MCKTKENQNRTKDKIELQHLQSKRSQMLDLIIANRKARLCLI